MVSRQQERVVLAMSGGVDSSVAALLLKEQGYEVIGLHMRLGDGSAADGPRKPVCCSAADAQDARRVAHALGIPFHVLNFRDEFQSLIRHFCCEYDRGRTPNPCIVCNQQLKFGKLLWYADALGAAWLATGHYARVEPAAGRRRLLRGVDPAKDQAYALFALSQQQLSRALFPLGSLRKEEVRRLAAEHDLKVMHKAESQDICFVPPGGYGELLRQRLPGRVRPGPVVDSAGRRLGTHPGVQLFTIGQRRGLGIALGQRRYVVALRRDTNTVVLGSSDELMRTKLIAEHVHWLSIDTPKTPLAAQVQIRYKHKSVPATIVPLPDGRARVAFDQPVRAITPGQAAVFYQGDVVLGGGWIAQLASHDSADRQRLPQERLCP